MRIVDRKRMLELPPGTVYRPVNGLTLGELTVRGESITRPHRMVQRGKQYPIDWYEINASNVLGATEQELIEHMTKHRGRVVVMEPEWCLEGSFDPDALFVVFDEADRKALVEMFGGVIPDE